MADQPKGRQGPWTEESSATYIDWADYFIPDRREQIDTICSLIPQFKKPFTVLDLCCGEGLLSREILTRFGNAAVVALDGSEKMIAAAKKNLSEFGGRAKIEFFDLADRSWRKRENVDVVVSSLAVHHLTHEEKHLLFRDMYEILNPGGAMLLADVICPKTASGKKHIADSWSEYVREKSIHTDGNENAYNYFKSSGWNCYSLEEFPRDDKPASLFEELKWIEEAGFKNVDAFFLKFAFAVFGGYKEGEL